jgi:hypothetical protein
MRIILISANGIGAGKTYLADELLRGIRLPLAAAVRHELSKEFPQYLYIINSTKQEDKLKELPNGKTVRQSLIELGQEKCKLDPVYWCKKWLSRLPEGQISSMTMNVLVDDVRKLAELNWFRNTFEDVTHVHLKYLGAVAEKNQDGTDVFDDLEGHANYVLERR